MNFRFAIISDPHVAVPHTIWNHPHRFHLVEVSILALERVLNHLEQLNLDFLLLPGDLTQDGEPDNHNWLQKRLQSLPFPVYVVPGNHDIPSLSPTERTIGFQEFPSYYRHCGYGEDHLYYSQEILPGVRIIALNSNQFNGEGKQLGCLDEAQLTWLEELLPQVKDQLLLVMIHHNVIEHLPGQTHHELGQRYMLDNAPLLLKMLRSAHCQLIFTGHLHVQDVAYDQGIYEITTGSLVSYPHPYRIIEVKRPPHSSLTLNVTSHRVDSVPGWENLGAISRQWLGDRSFPFMVKLLTASPLKVSVEEAEKLAPFLRDFWSDVAAGDGLFDFPDFPPPIRQYFQQFSAIKADGTPALIDNQAVLNL
ncbi:metallophosphoesterase [Crocosphaera sp. UHCC 0190]|uniref:metallophosphoesterase family protein n=1 Tax=Crocosphaera sp. UHCC 0190 TaxID=3110246 RepID=UPI002B21FEB4|nr:metallophosphoesterase [Crocosphaera sp. UHCC 0190]MEA5512135.1 metallophosphoesterase [Crocosphaera sp. UHCC 0190]